MRGSERPAAFGLDVASDVIAAGIWAIRVIGAGERT
jgi:hypothetical protein